MWVSGEPKSLQDATVDEGYCLGSIPNTYMNTHRDGQFTSVPNQYLGEQKEQAYCPGDRMVAWTGVSAFHYGTHFIDMIPQSAAQIEGMQHCPNGADVDWISGDRMANYPLPCYDPNSNPSPHAEGHLKGTIRLSVPLSLKGDTEGGSEYRLLNGELADPFSVGGQFMVKTEFTLPAAVRYEAGQPITFRWMWFCGVDVANGDVQNTGMGELFHQCMDARIGDNCGVAPPVTTASPVTDSPVTTAEPVTTAAPVTTEEEPLPCPGPIIPPTPETQCRRLMGSIFASDNAWCETNCVYNGVESSDCCFTESEGQCDTQKHHCYCPGLTPTVLI